MKNLLKSIVQWFTDSSEESHEQKSEEQHQAMVDAAARGGGKDAGIPDVHSGGFPGAG
jgi:hypothetical protein